MAFFKFADVWSRAARAGNRSVDGAPIHGYRVHHAPLRRLWAVMIVMGLVLWLNALAVIHGVAQYAHPLLREGHVRSLLQVEHSVKPCESAESPEHGKEPVQGFSVERLVPNPGFQAGWLLVVTRVFRSNWTPVIG